MLHPQGLPSYPGYATVQAVPFSVNAVGAVFVPLQEPLKPGSELTVPPAGIEPL